MKQLNDCLLAWPRLALPGALLLVASLSSVLAYDLSVTIEEPANNAWFASRDALYTGLYTNSTGPIYNIVGFGGYMTVDSTAEMFDIGATITCRVRRDADGSYWNGSGWGTDPVDLSTDVNDFKNGGGRPWQCTSGLPLGNQVVEGGYTLTAHASEGLSSANTSCHVTFDFTRPVPTITSPQDSAALVTFPFIGGTAVD